MTFLRSLVVMTALTTIAAAAGADTRADYVPELGTFPPSGVGVELAGELVTLDHVNRRGGPRLDGDFEEDRYDPAPSFAFALLPYGEVYFHGAPADLHDLPLGTRLSGRFLLPPEGDTTIPAVASKYLPRRPVPEASSRQTSPGIRTGPTSSFTAATSGSTRRPGRRPASGSGSCTCGG